MSFCQYLHSIQNNREHLGLFDTEGIGCKHGRDGFVWALAEVYLHWGSVVAQSASINVALFLMKSLQLVHAKRHLGVSFVCQ